MLQQHGMCVQLVMSYVVKWMKMKTTRYLEGEFIFINLYLRFQFYCELMCLLHLRKGVEVNIWDLTTHTKLWTAKSVTSAVLCLRIYDFDSNAL